VFDAAPAAETLEKALTETKRTVIAADKARKLRFFKRRMRLVAIKKLFHRNASTAMFAGVSWQTDALLCCFEEVARSAPTLNAVMRSRSGSWRRVDAAHGLSELSEFSGIESWCQASNWDGNFSQSCHH